MQSLKYLNLARCSLEMEEGVFEASLLSYLVQLPQLTHLVLSDNPFIAKLPHVNSLIIRRLTQLLFYNNKETEVNEVCSMSLAV